jgi:hypothetical protein
MLESVLNEAAHLSHKDWGVTSKNSDKLSRSLSISSDEEQSSSVLSNHAKQLLERILSEGNWEGAAKHSLAKRNQQAKPWAVLVTGCNGIRKTTSMYQPWFQEILSEALCPPGKGEKSMKPEFLPTGANSFFRQLDHMIATLMNEGILFISVTYLIFLYSTKSLIRFYPFSILCIGRVFQDLFLGGFLP